MWQKELANRMQDAETSVRKDIIAEYEVSTGHSLQHLYRVAKKNGFITGRVRSDKGVLKSGLTDGQIEFVAGLLYVTGRENKGPIMPIERALQIAVDNEIIEEDQVSLGTITRVLRDRQLSKRHMKAPNPHIEMRSLHPNHTHVFDVSVCIQYYLKNKKLNIMDEREFYKNKPENFEKIKERLLRYVIVDHFSGAMYFKYYSTTGETQANLYDFLKEAWSPKTDDRLPFRGVPFNLLMDAGSGNTSRAIVGMLERMDVNIPKGLPHNPRRQGAVETAHTIIEQWFETVLRIQPATSTEELNAWGLDFLIWFSAKKLHSRHGMPRTQCWMQIKPEELRELPPVEMLQDLFRNPEEDRTVDGGYHISFRGKPYQLKHIPGLFKGAKIKAVLKPWKWPVIDVIYKETTYEVNPIERLSPELGRFNSTAAVIGEEFKASPETITQKAKEAIENLAYGETKKKDSKPFAGIKVFGHHAGKVGLSFIEKKGRPLEVSRDTVDHTIPFTEFLKRVVQHIGPISKELNQKLRAKHGDAITLKEVDAAIKRLEGREEIKKDQAVI